MVRNDKRKYDGQVSFLGGQDSGILAHLLSDDQSSELWNATVRKGKIRPRPAFNKLPLTFPRLDIQTWFEGQLSQGSIVFTSKNGMTVQVWSVGGRFFTVDLNNNNLVNEITPSEQTTVAIAFTAPAVGSPVAITVANSDRILEGYPITIGGKFYNVTSKAGSVLTAVNIDDTPATVWPISTIVSFLDPNSPKEPICYMIQAEDFLIAQDGKSRAFIFDGGNSRRADPTIQEVPTGKVMAYGIGRLWVDIGAGKFVGSDIIYGPSGTSAYDKRDAILKFTENTFLAGGGAFVVPGEITAMQFVSSLDTSTGQGPLMVFTELAVCSVNAPTDREAWAQINNPIQTISLLANGALSFYGTVPTVNGDIFYRSLDGMRSFFLARREYGTWGSTPISGELSNSMDDDGPNQMRFHSAIVFENRLLFTVGSVPTDYGAYWKGIGALDFDPLTNMRSKVPPVYDGTWTGVNVLWLFAGRYGHDPRAFMVVRSAAGLNELWEISKDSQFENGTGRIRWTIITRSFAFQNPLEMLRLDNLELFPRNVIGQCDITVSYRADDYPCWFPWKDQPVCANWRKCDGWQNCETPIAFRGGYKTRIGFGEPPDTDEDNDGKPARLGYVHQLKIEIEGYCELHKLRVAATQVDEEPTPKVDQPENCEEINCCPDNYYAWRSVDATNPGGES